MSMVESNKFGWSAKTAEGLEFIKLALSEAIEAHTLQEVDERLGSGGA